MSRDNYLERIAERVKEVREKPIDGDSERKHKWYMKNRDRILAMAKDVKIAHDEEKYLTSDKSIKIIAEHLYNAGYRKASDLAEEIFAEIEKIIDKYYNRHIFGVEDLSDVEQEAVMNFSDDITYDIAELKKKYIGEDTNVTTNTEDK